MAADDRPHGDSPIRRLQLEAWRFDFHQAVRVLEALVPRATPVGQGADPRREVVRFRGALASGFPASDLSALQFDPTADEPPQLEVNFLGLGGPFGPLPAPLTELVQDRLRVHDTAARDFLDLFNHRLISLAARIRRAHRPALQPGRPEDGPFAALLFALLGLRTPGLRHTLGRNPSSRMRGLDAGLPLHAGLLNQRPASLHTVERLLSSHFGVPIRGTPMVGRWLRLDEDQVSVLGRNGRNQRLGNGAVLGSRIWDQAATIQLDPEPLSLPEFRRFLPGAAKHCELRTLVGYTLGQSVDVRLRLTLPPLQVPRTRLSRKPELGAQLGWTSFLTTRLRKEPGVVTVAV
jgi:type VI secretion system protein ImpH